MKKNHVIAVVLIAVAPVPAFAYIDPGTGSLAVQALIAAVAGALVALRGGWTRVKSWLVRPRARPHAPPGTTDQSSRNR